MTIFQILSLLPLCTFYISYFVKMLLLKRQGIKGNIMGKGEKPKQALLFERVLGGMTALIAVTQFVSVLFPPVLGNFTAGHPAWVVGFLLAAVGCTVFIIAIIKMQNNWRAGFNEEQNTRLVTDGIYSISRNPAFLGFDLLYIGTALSFPNIPNSIVTIATIMLFHIQIRGEEAFLEEAFGALYAEYKARVRRYLGRK